MKGNTMETELKKGQIVEVSDDGKHWKLRRFSLHHMEGIFAYDGIGREEHDVWFKLWRLPE